MDKGGTQTIHLSEFLPYPFWEPKAKRQESWWQCRKLTWTNWSCQKKRRKRTHQRWIHTRTEEYIKTSKERLITTVNNRISSINTKRITTKKLGKTKWEETKNNCIDTSIGKLGRLRTWWPVHGYKRENFGEKLNLF